MIELNPWWILYS